MQLKRGFIYPLVVCYVAGSFSNSIVLRFRLTDGSVQKISVNESSILSDVVRKIQRSKDIKTQLNGKALDTSLPISDLDLKNGSFLTLSSASALKTKGLQKAERIKSDTAFVPFPDLARDYTRAKILASRKRSGGGGLSYGDLASLQSNLFVVDPQSSGPLLRTYMCQHAAARFQANAIVKQTVKNRCGLLLGTLQRERVDTKPRPKTSLSTPLTESDYCQVCKVHAILDNNDLTYTPQVQRVAGYLGLRPVGWIFTYDDDRHKDEDTLPVFGEDIQKAAHLQIENMKNDEIQGSRFVTLSMDGKTGATEAFQMSDVAVQMVSQDTFVEPKGRFVTTQHPVVVDGKETTKLDSVLCLINTALLSHEGSYTTSKSHTKRNGSLTNKSVKALVKALEESDDGQALDILSDFAVLLAVDHYLSETEMTTLAETVRKRARGQRKGTRLDPKLRKKLLSSLQG